MKVDWMTLGVTLVVISLGSKFSREFKNILMGEF